MNIPETFCYITLTLVLTVSGVIMESWTPEKFGASLMKELAKTDHDNWLISPSSLTSVLGMLYFGASGRTQKEIGTVLHLSKKKYIAKSQLFEYIRNLRDDNSEEVTWSSVECILVDRSLNTKKKSFGELEMELNAKVNKINFSNPSSSLPQLNNWMNNQSKGLIKQFVFPGLLKKDSLVVALNEAFFESQWMFPFSSSKTERSCFYSDGHSCTIVHFMSFLGQFHFSYSEEIGAKILQLPFKMKEFEWKGGYSMVLVLPFVDKTIEQVLDRLVGIPLTSQLNETEKSQVDILIPKFDNSFQVDLSKQLKKLGIQDLFSYQVKLPKIFQGLSTPVSQVIHTSKISLKESGVSAGAGSASIMERTHPATFYAKHPFLYFIVKDETKILFGGQMVTPNYL